MHSKVEFLLPKERKDLRQLNETAYKFFRKKNQPLKLLSHFSFYSSHTKHYHLYYLEVAFKTFLP